MSRITATFTATDDVTEGLYVHKGDRFSFRVSIGGGGMNCRVQFSVSQLGWANYQEGQYDDEFLDGPGDFAPRFFTAERDGYYRLHTPLHVGGSFDVEIQDEPKVLDQIQSQRTGKIVWKVTEEGVSGPEAGSLYGPGSAEGEVGFGYGLSIDEAMRDIIVDEIIQLPTDAAFVDITKLLPAGVLPISVALLVTEPITDGGDRVKLSLGVSGGDLDKYGVIDDPILGATLVSLYANGSTVLAGTEQIAINGTQADGTTIGTTDFSDGQVRVQIVYRDLAALAEAVIDFP